MKRQVSTVDAFIAVVELERRSVSKESLAVAEFLRARRFLERRGCIRLLMKTELEQAKSDGARDQGRILEGVERKFEAYYDALHKGGYL